MYIKNSPLSRIARSYVLVCPELGEQTGITVGVDGNSLVTGPKPSIFFPIEIFGAPDSSSRPMLSAARARGAPFPVAKQWVWGL